MENGAGDRRSVVNLILALAMCGYVAWHSRFWGGARDAFAHVGADYAALRTQLAFDRTPIASIARRLDEILPRDVPVALAPPLVKNDALRQRLIEGLYPRRVDRTAVDVLALGRDGSVRTPVADPSMPARPTETELESFAFDLPGLLVSIGALLGFGFLVRALVPGLRPEGRDELAVPIAVLAGSAVVGGLVYAATFAQVGVPWWVYRLAGWGALGYAAARAKPWRGTGRIAAAAKLTPEAWVLVTLLAVLLWKMAALPITGWDGRSIWLFHAKQIFFQRMMSLADLHHVDWEWSHPVYPWLLPGAMAMFGGAGRVFNERMAALAVPIVWSGSLAMYWCLARLCAGRLAGAALTIALFFGTEGLVGDLYMDGLVAALLAVTILSLSRAELRGVGILAAFVVSLVKIEGAVAAGLILVGFACFDRRRGRRLGTTAALLSPILLPAVHRIWLSLHDVTEVQANVGVAKAIEDLPLRLPVVLDGLPATLLRATSGQQVETQAMLRVGFVGLVCALGVLLWRVRRAGERPPVSASWWVALGAGATLLLLAVGLVCGMPQEAAWLVTWTLDRLLLHPALVFAMLPFL
jgi:hypothetical protein